VPVDRQGNTAVTTKLPAAVIELLTTRIDSFEKLEILVALHAAPRATMSVDELCQVAKLSREVVRQAALEMRAAALVELTVRGEVQLLPPTSADLRAVSELVALYNDDRFLIAKALGEIAVARIRGMASRVFAEAFVIRKKPKDGDNG
jgi:hypothetical protein